MLQRRASYSKVMPFLFILLAKVLWFLFFLDMYPDWVIYFWTIGYLTAHLVSRVKGTAF